MIDFEKWAILKSGWSSNENDWIMGFYYDPKSGNGDFFYNTCRSIIEDELEDDDYVLEEIFFWLDRGKRWPDWADYLITTKNHKQTDITQDPWIMAYCCAAYLGRYDLIEKYKPGAWVLLPDKWAWRRALLGKPNLYWLWRRITPYRFMQWFVYVFYGFMEKAYLNK